MKQSVNIADQMFNAELFQVESQLTERGLLEFWGIYD